MRPGLGVGRLTGMRLILRAAGGSFCVSSFHPGLGGVVVFSYLAFQEPFLNSIFYRPFAVITALWVWSTLFPFDRWRWVIEDPLCTWYHLGPRLHDHQLLGPCNSTHVPLLRVDR